MVEDTDKGQEDDRETIQRTGLARLWRSAPQQQETEELQRTGASNRGLRPSAMKMENLDDDNDDDEG